MADEDLEKAKRKLLRIRETNAMIVGEIESMGTDIDFLLPRLEHFMVSLVELGVITEEQMINIALKWEYNLKEQIVPVVQEHRVRQRAMIEEARRREAEARKKAQTEKDKPTRVMLDMKPDVNDPSDVIILPGIQDKM